MPLSRTFCICFPVRLGVFVISLTQLAFGTTTAALVWQEVAKNSAMSSLDKAAFILAGVVYSLSAMAAFIGLFGAGARARRLVAVYSIAVLALVVLSLASGIFFLVIIFRMNSTTFYQDCMARLGYIERRNPQFVARLCGNLLSRRKASYVVSLIISFVLQLYAALIVRSYVSQLTDEQFFRTSMRDFKADAKSGAKFGYYRHKPITNNSDGLQDEMFFPPKSLADDQDMATSPPREPLSKTQYTYTDPYNAFGSQNVPYSGALKSGTPAMEHKQNLEEDSEAEPLTARRPSFSNIDGFRG